MPLPWKKKKVGRISNFVADLQSPKRRGSSLVVQTGFPTSIIDLFVKNRGRFRKPKPPPPDPEPLDFNDRLLPTSPELVTNGDADVVTASDQVHEQPSLGECIGASNSDHPNKVTAAAILKTLLLLALTLSVQRLTFGITISAFLLLFLEFASKHVLFCFQHYFSPTLPACAWFQTLVSVIGKRQSFREGLGPPSLVCENIELQSSSASDEIEIVEPKSETGTGNSCGEICSLGSELDSFYEDKTAAGSAIQEVCEITQDKIKSRRGGELKSKIAKKLRGLTKKKRTKDREEIDRLSKEKESESYSEVPSSVEGDESAIPEIEEEGIKAQENWSKLECIEDEEVDFGITGSHQEVEEGESNVQKQEQEKERIHRGGSSVSGALMLFIVALAGLVMGRLPAFLLAVTWMFMLKILIPCTRSLNVHLIKCCEQITS